MVSREGGRESDKCVSCSLLNFESTDAALGLGDKEMVNWHEKLS